MEIPLRVSLGQKTSFTDKLLHEESVRSEAFNLKEVTQWYNKVNDHYVRHLNTAMLHHSNVTTLERRHFD